MTLAHLAYLLDIDPKRVLNTMTALRRRRYSVDLARRLAVALAIHEATGGPIARGFAQADHALRAYQGGAAPVLIPSDDGAVGLLVDVRRVLSSFNVRLSLLGTTFAPRQRGRPTSRRRDPLQVASGWGIDLSLLTDNLSRTVEQRMRQLDAMEGFARRVRRRPSSAP